MQNGYYSVQTGFYPVQTGFHPVQTGCIRYFFIQTDYTVNITVISYFSGYLSKGWRRRRTTTTYTLLWPRCFATRGQKDHSYSKFRIAIREYLTQKSFINSRSKTKRAWNRRNLPKESNVGYFWGRVFYSVQKSLSWASKKLSQRPELWRFKE